MLKNKSGFCGIGAYGGNQILPFYKAGYPCLFANTATTDLESLTEVEDQYKYQIPGGEGCNKDRTKSRELFRKDIDNIINEVKEKLPGIEYLFVVASLGGGTGAGSVMPMKRVAMNDLNIKACIVITVLPNTKTESIQALINSYETLAELEALEEPGTMFILDNDKNNNKMKINEIFFCHLDALLTLDCNSALGNIDDAEVEQMLCSRGVSIISKLGKDKSDIQNLISTFHNNVYAPLEDDKVEINKMSAATDTISKVNNEISVNQQAANKYLEYANQVGLSEDYKSKIRNGQLSIENITDENTRDLVSKYQEYYEAYLDASDKVLDLQDKLTDLAEKRLEIIEKEYNYIEDIQTSLQDRLEADRELLKSLGTAINNSLNVESLNESVKAQEEIYNQLTKKLADYQAEVDSQLKSGLMKQGSEQWYDAMKNINDFTANIAKASSELIELSDKLREIKYDTLQYIIDGFSRSTDKLSAYIDLLDARDEKVPEELYQQQIDNNNASIQKQYALREEKLKEQGLYDVGSERYQDLAEDISKADEEILKLRKDNEDLKDSIYELRISNLEKTIQGYSDLEDELKDMRDLLNDDAFLDKNGGITDEGLAQIALLSQSLGNAKKTIADYTTGLQKLKELYENGIISLDEYNDKSAEYRKGIREATSDVKSYQDSLTSLYTDALKAEVDALDKLIDKRKKALEAKEDYYNYDKKIRSQQKDVDTIKAQIAALTGVKSLLH